MPEAGDASIVVVGAQEIRHPQVARNMCLLVYMPVQRRILQAQDFVEKALEPRQCALGDFLLVGCLPRFSPKRADAFKAMAISLRGTTKRRHLSQDVVSNAPHFRDAAAQPNNQVVRQPCGDAVLVQVPTLFADLCPDAPRLNTRQCPVVPILGMRSHPLRGVAGDASHPRNQLAFDFKVDVRTRFAAHRFEMFKLPLYLVLKGVRLNGFVQARCERAGTAPREPTIVSLLAQ